MKKFQAPRFTLALLPALLLAACGGGGGDGGSGAFTGQVTSQVVITDSNAEPVAADALQTTGSNGLAATGTALVTGVQVDAAGDTSAPLQIAAAARHLIAMAPAAPALATAATSSQTVACSGGGSLSISGSVASSSQLSAGDQVTISASGCSEVVDGASERLDGTVSITVLAGPFNPSSTVYPKSVQLRISAQNLSIAQGGQTSVSNGDLEIGVVQNSATVASMALNATVLSSSVTTASGTRSVTLRNYFQHVDQAPTGSVVQVSANVETNSSRLGTGTVAYSLSTPTDLRLNANGAYTGGSLKVTGLNSALLLTVTGTDTFSLQVDANGDGTFDSSRTVTRAQLNAQL